MDKEMFLPIYKTLIRPRLEHAIQAWSPYLQKDIIKLEKVQRRATKLIPELAHLPYEDRLKELGLATLREREDKGGHDRSLQITTWDGQAECRRGVSQAWIRAPPGQDARARPQAPETETRVVLLTRLWLKWVESELSRPWKSRIWVESESNHADRHLSQSWVNWILLESKLSHGFFWRKNVNILHLSVALPRMNQPTAALERTPPPPPRSTTFWQIR